MAVGMATVDDPGVGVMRFDVDECEESSTVVVIFEGLAGGAASRQVVAAAAAAVFRCASDTCRSTCTEVERHVKDRLGLIAQPLRAQVAEGLATGVSSRNAAHLVSRDTLVRSNAAKHQGFHSDVLISEVPVRVLRNRQRGARKKEVAKEAEQQSMEAELQLEQKKQAEQEMFKKAKKLNYEKKHAAKLMADAKVNEAKALAENCVTEAKKLADELLAEEMFEAAKKAKVVGRTLMTVAHWSGAKVTAAEKVLVAEKLAEAMVTEAKQLAYEKVVKSMKEAEVQLFEEAEHEKQAEQEMFLGRKSFCPV